MVRDGPVTMYDIRRSVSVVSFWPPRSGGILVIRLSRVTSQVSEALVSDTSLSSSISSLVREYWSSSTSNMERLG